MIAHRYHWRARLELLASAVLDYLDATFTEADLDDDSSPPHTERAARDLYNLAGALAAAAPLVGARQPAARLQQQYEEHADNLLDDLVAGAGAGRVRKAFERLEKEGL